MSVFVSIDLSKVVLNIVTIPYIVLLTSTKAGQSRQDIQDIQDIHFRDSAKGLRLGETPCQCRAYRAYRLCVPIPRGSSGTALCLPSATHLADFSLYFYWTKCPFTNFPLS